MSFTIQCIGDTATDSTWYPLIGTSASSLNNSGANTNISVSTSASSYTCEVASLPNYWYGAMTPTGISGTSLTSATIQINSRTIGSEENNRLSTITHEMGHLIGLADDPPVLDSLMRHGRNREIIYTPQEFDIANVKFVYNYD